MAKLYLLLGGNLGDKKKVFAEAKDLLANRIGPITALSGIYETEPWGFRSDELFWNQALEIETSLSPEMVLAATQTIEQELGRKRETNQYASRIIDIDILFYDDFITQTEALTIPHPRIQERRFSLVPLCEIAPELKHPSLGKTMLQLLSDCPDHLKVSRI